ncbi:hypothetical protein LWI29_034500 [Acer saccharum]|uniref:Protein kinase domain-containing protein n=1 Tax=Acer saccharum TaxID=4024 RepID=A0AA39S3W9_ACESA|nr:hypothetical protein LWI29_034500 [Acer saccharum]
MEQFRQVGEVLGSLKALMVLKDDIQINQRQCCLLLDMFTLAFTVISEEIRLYLKAEERNTKWKALEQPLKELQRVFKEGEIYVKQCLDNRDWWSKAINFHHNKDCVEYHIHNLLCCFPGVVEAIESAGEISGLDPDEMQRRRVALARKYDKEWNDPKLFQLRFGKEYLVQREICSRFESAWKEDRYLLVEALREKKRLGSVVLTKNEQRLVDMLLKKLNGSEPGSEKQLFPTSILLRGKDYQVRRRLGGGSEYKEIQWLGDSFAVRHFFGEIKSLNTEISTLLSLSHPNILQYHCGFFDEEKKEFYLVMELMSKDLSVYIKENCGSRRRLLFSIPVVVDLMLQIARGMEFLHSRKIYHGDLNPSNIFLKARSSAESYFHVKVSGFGLTDVRSRASRKAVSPPPPPPSQNGNSTATATSTSPTLQIQNMPHFIWHAPEILAEQEQQSSMFKHTEKADVYSFGMLCFELLTGKVPFEDSHLQGDTMARNIRAGGRPLFPSGSPKYLVNLTKRCWHTNPSQRPSFSSICRILRYIKKFLVMNPEIVESFQSPLADYYDIEAAFVKKFVGEGNSDVPSVSQIPFQMFAYRIAEKDKAIMSNKDKQWDLSSDASSLDLIAPAANNDSRSVCSDVKSVCFDLRSVYSEVPGKRISNFDMRSVCSEAPNKNLIRSITRPLLHSKIPEKNSDTKSERNVTPEKRIPSSDTRSVCSRNSDKKTVVIKKTTDVKVEKDSGAIKARSAKTAPKTRPARSSATAQSPSGRSSGPPESLRKWSSKIRQNSLSPSAMSPGSPSRRKFSSSVSGSKFPGSPSRQKVPANLSGSESPGSPRRRKFPVNQSGSESPGSPSRRKSPNNLSGFECPGSPSRRKLPINKSGFECPGSPSRLRASVNVSGSENPESPSRIKTAISLPSSYAESPGSPSRLKMAVCLSSSDIVRRNDVPGSEIA